MRELNALEIDLVDGGESLAYDLGHDLGDAVQGVINDAKWYLMNYAFTGQL